MFIKQLSVCDVPQLFGEFGKCCANQTGALRALRRAAHCGAPRIAAHRTYMGSCRKKNDWQFSNPRIDTVSGFVTMTSRAHNIRSRCAIPWLPTPPSGGYSAAPLPSSPQSGLTSHCESDKLSLLSLVRMKLTRNNHCERGFRLWLQIVLSNVTRGLR